MKIEFKKELKVKQAELKKYLKQMELSQRIFSERVFYHINDSDNKKEIDQFYEKFKKDINRDTTELKKIEKYLKILFEQSEFSKLNLVKLSFHYKNDFTDDFNEKMKKISKIILE